MSGQLAQVDLTIVYFFCDRLGIQAGFHHGVADVPGSTHGQQAVGHQMVDDHVGHGDIHLIDAIDAQQTAHGTLCGHGGMLIDETLHIRRYVSGGCTGLINEFKIKSQFAFHNLPLTYFLT